jgi:hypothetical protein
VPYLTARHSSGQKVTSALPATRSVPAHGISAAPIAAPLPAPASPQQGSAVPLDSPRFNSVDQFLRFDVTKEWVYRYWSRKSTGPTDVGLFSVRVPLVMGTQRTSLAGSLTYYFNSNGAVEHISFRGRTADTTPLVNFLMRTYEFQRVEGPVGEQVYQVQRRKRVQSELRTWPAAILNSGSPHSSIAVELELARPGSARFLPPRGPALAVPQVASPPAPVATQDASAATPSGSAASTYINGIRYATPQEEAHVLWKRWPN